MSYTSPKKIAPKKYKDAKKAVAAIKHIYERNVAFLHDNFMAYAKGTVPKKPVRACYPYIKISPKNIHRQDSRVSFGFAQKNGAYSTTVTRPDIFDKYYLRQIQLLLKNHDCGVEIGESDSYMPVHFALGEDFHLESDLSPKLIEDLPYYFDRPDLELMDDEIANCTYQVSMNEDKPLSLFKASRVDLSLLRLRHYCGTSSKNFQNFVIFTNYQFYIDEFVKISRGLMEKGHGKKYEHQDDAAEYLSFVSPGDHVIYNQEAYPDKAEETGFNLSRMPQMPAYHLKRADGNGITMVNIGVGPSNAKTITDHVAVLRPHAWLMLGHCAGLRQSQSLGDYVLAHGYLRLDNVLNKDLPIGIPIPPLAEIQQALETAVSEVIGLKGYDRKKVMRTGTVATIDDRNWELQPAAANNLMLSQSRAIALDMESATIAANGFRFRVPYGTLLCVSDKPFHGQLKLPGMADSFYRERVNQHLQIGLLAMSTLRNMGPDRLHSRKLRSFNEVAFQ
jgi:AMP nucleosidase